MKSKKINYGLLLGIFGLMLICNIMTDFLVDDFTYLFDFRNDQRITNVFQIFGSMKAHASSMNGRLFAHFFAQLFLFLPKWIFNIVNSLVFTITIVLINKIANQGKLNIWIIAGLFSSIWIFSPAFGQVFLWVDGACNYLWAYFFGLLFIVFYVNRFISDKTITNGILKFLFFVISFMMGAYSENSSSAFICVAFLILFIQLVLYKRKPKLYEIFGLIISFLGYITIYLAPAQWSNKAAKLTLHTIRLNFINAIEIYKKFTPVLIVFVILLAITIYCKVDKKILLLSISFFAGSLLSNFMMILASYYDHRSSVASLILLLVATCILLAQVLQSEYKLLSFCLCSALFLCTIYHLCIGVNDIYNTHCEIGINKNTIEYSKEIGVMDIELNVVAPQTKYSAAHGLLYLSTETSNTWPNYHMAKYYEVNSIIGKAPN